MNATPTTCPPSCWISRSVAVIVPPVLELVLALDGLARELAELAHRHEPRVELMRERTAEDEAARLYPDHHVDSLALVSLRQEVDDTAEGRAVLQQRRDVLEQDPLRREILDVSYFRPQLGKIHAAHITGSLAQRTRRAR